MRERRNQEGKGTDIWIRTKKKKKSGVRFKILYFIYLRKHATKATLQVGELIISSLRAADEGVYTCTISNSKGSIEHNTTVRAEARVVAGQPQIQVVG